MGKYIKLLTTILIVIELKTFSVLLFKGFKANKNKYVVKNILNVIEKI